MDRLKIMLVVLLFLSPLAGYAQVMLNLSDLRTRIGTDGSVVILLGSSSINDGNGDMFYWNPTDVQADNGVSVIKVTGFSTGSWIRLKILNSKIGTYTGSGALATTSYVVTHSLGSIPSFVAFTPTSSSAASLSYENKAARTSTTFTIVFTANPAVGTNNLTFDWLVRL